MKKMKIKADEYKIFTFNSYDKKRRKKPNLSIIIILIIFINSLIFFIIGLFMGRNLFQNCRFSSINTIINSNYTNTSNGTNINNDTNKNIYSNNKINLDNSSKSINSNSNINIITANPIIYNNSKNITIGSQSINYISFAQQLEDLILFIFLYDVEKGFYIDVGANSPMYDTVTRNFYEKGWNGINIEPLDDKYSSIIQNRKRDINLQMVASDKPGDVTLYINDQLTTFEKKYSSSLRTKIIKADTMSNICKKYVPTNTRIEFCKIDVEGAEPKVLLGYDFENYRPKIFCIESYSPKYLSKTYKEFEPILFKNNYTLAYKHRINRYYIDNSFAYLKNRTNLIDNAIEDYIVKYNLDRKKIFEKYEF